MLPTFQCGGKKGQDAQEFCVASVSELNQTLTLPNGLCLELCVLFIAIKRCAASRLIELVTCDTHT